MARHPGHALDIEHALGRDAATLPLADRRGPDTKKGSELSERFLMGTAEGGECVFHLRNDFHIGNHTSRRQISITDIRDAGLQVYSSRMIKRIGPSTPARHYLAEWIAQRGLDQKRVAERLDCEPGTVSKLITGKQRLNDVWIARFAKALDISPDAVFRDPARPYADDLLRGLNAEDQARVINFMEGLRRTG